MKIREKLSLPLTLATTALLFSSPSLNAAGLESESYTWKPVVMGGAGFVTGYVFHPSEKGLLYCRTDMGGAYRRDGDRGLWIPITDWITLDDVNLMGIESIALDPNDPNRVYIAAGTNTGIEAPNGAILRSTDRGNTFEIIRIPAKFGGNENGRGNGERMAVDPKRGATILLGTRFDGLLRSDDYGSTWTRITSFPDLMEKAPEGMDNALKRDMWIQWMAGSGIIRVIFAPESAASDHSDTIYAAVSIPNQPSLFVSRDGGNSWTAISGQPTQFRPTDMDLGADGVLYVSYGTATGPMPMTDGAVWRYDTKTAKWADITPAQSGAILGNEHSFFGYCSVAVDPQKPGVVIATPFWYIGGEELFRSLDGGKTWKPIIRTCGRFDYSKIPYSETPNIHWLFDVEINPFDSDHLLFTSGFGGMETFDLTKADAPDATKANGNLWQPMMLGIEESVPLDMFSPKEGPQLVTAIGDYGGFIHWNLDVSPVEGSYKNPRFDNTTGLGVAWQKQNIYVRAGTATRGIGSNIAFSKDSGKTWSNATNIEDGSRNGSVAISADGSTCIWTPESKRKKGDWNAIEREFFPHVTSDNGMTWTKCDGLPASARVVSDTVNPLKFYTFDLFNRIFYRSTDGGRTFKGERISLPGGLPFRSKMRGDTRGGQDRLYLTPDREGDIWLAAFDGLYRIDEKTATATRMPHVQELRAFGFGAAKPGADYPAIYVIGVIDGVRGIFRSDDIGQSYVLINDAVHQYGSLLLICGDMRQYGRVYVGTHGRGALYGDIAEPVGTMTK